MHREIVFIGSSPLGLRELVESGLFSVVKAVCLRARVTDALKSEAARFGLELELFDWIADFRDVIRQFPKGMPFFIYQLDMLVPADLIGGYDFYNVHRGNLMTNRGPNPDVRAILNGEPSTALSLHKINDKIDAGVLVDEYFVEIGPDDDTVSVQKKLEQGLPQLLTSLSEYLEGRKEGRELVDGAYYPWIEEYDFTIDPDRDSLEIADRKIRSQRQYNGAIVWIGGEKKYVLAMHRTSDEGQVPGFREDGKLYANVTIDSEEVVLELNPAPKCPPPVKRPKATRV